MTTAAFILESLGLTESHLIRNDLQSDFSDTAWLQWYKKGSIS